MAIVKEKHLQAAFDYWDAQPHPKAAADYNLCLTQTAAKAAYAKAFLEATGTVAERECKAELDEAYQAAKAAEAEAIFQRSDHAIKLQRAENLISVWHGEQATERRLVKAMT